MLKLKGTVLCQPSGLSDQEPADHKEAEIIGHTTNSKAKTRDNCALQSSPLLYKLCMVFGVCLSPRNSPNCLDLPRT